MQKPNYKELSSLALAYIGDAVYEVMVRQHLLNQKIAKVNQLHKAATKFVSAPRQSLFINTVFAELTTEEQEIVMRGRNTKSNTSAKNATINEYRYSTAFECLVGYLYLTDQIERLQWLFDKIVTIGEGDVREHHKL